MDPFWKALAGSIAALSPDRQDEKHEQSSKDRQQYEIPEDVVDDARQTEGAKSSRQRLREVAQSGYNRPPLCRWDEDGHSSAYPQQASPAWIGGHGTVP